MAKILENKSKEIRRRIIETIVHAGKGHIGGALSSVDLLVTLYYGDILRFGGKQVGHVTSVVSDASFNSGLAYVRRIASKPGSFLSTLDDNNVVEVLSIVDMFG